MAGREVELRRLLVRLVGDMSQYQKMLDNAVKVTSTKMKQVGKKMSDAGKTLQRKLTLPLAAVGTAAVIAFGQFDQAMTESTSIMKVTEEQTNRMREAALRLSAGGELQQGPKDLAKSYFFLASAGKDAEQSMALLPKVSKFATAGAFDMALATDLLTDAQSALGLTSKETAKDVEGLSRVADVLVKANTLANASVQQFSEAITNNAGASLKAYNKDVEEGVAVLAAYADQGIKGNVAGSNLSRVILLLSKSAQDNAKAHKELNFQVFDGNGKMRNFADIIGNLETITKGMSDETKSATLTQLGFAARVQAAILPLLGSSEAIRGYETDLRSAGGIVEEVAGKQMKSFNNQLGIMKNQLTVVAIEIGQALVPVIQQLTVWLKEGIAEWNKLSTSQKEFIVQAGLVLGALGPVLIILGQIVIAVGAMIGALGSAGTAFIAVGTAIKGASLTLSLWSAGLAAVAVGIGTVVKLVYDLISAINEHNEALENSGILNDRLNAARTKEVGKAIEAAKKLNNIDDRKGLLTGKIKQTEKEISAIRKTVNQAANDLSLFTFGGNLSPFQFAEKEAELEEAKSRLKAAQGRKTTLEGALKNVGDFGKEVPPLAGPKLKPLDVASLEKTKDEKDPDAKENAQNHKKSAEALAKMANDQPTQVFLQGAI